MTFYLVASEGKFRWRIFKSSDKNFVNIAADVAKIHRDNSGIKTCWENFFISVSMRTKIFVTNPAELEIKIPEIVTNAAIEILRESTKAIYGFNPTVITKLEGKEKIFAYLERPFDLNIILLKNFFADFGDFDKIFPYECTDNYKIICQLLDIFTI